MTLKKYAILTYIVCCCSLFGVSQTHTHNITGTVLNASNKTPIPFANVYLKQSLKGTVSNEHGEFSLTYNESKDTLIISAIGFTPYAHPTNKIKKHLDIKLNEENVQIKEVRIKPKKSRSYELLELIHAHEKENNTHYFSGFEGKEYHRTAIVFKNLDNEIKDKKIFKSTPGAFIAESDSTCSIPVLIEEVVNRFIVPANGSDLISERLLEQRNSLDVFSGADMDDITNEMTLSQNFYKPFIRLLDKNFASPISLSSRFYYKMWVIDSTYIDGVKHIRVDFKPKRPKDLAFYGYFWVETQGYAITEMKVNLSPRANINYVEDVRIHNVYEKIIDGKWYYKSKKTELVINYTPSNDTLKTINTYVSKVTGYRDIKKTTANELSSDIKLKEKIAQVNSLKGDELKSYWDKNRFENMDTNEIQIYACIDTLKNNQFVQFFDKTVNMFLTGYWQVNKIDIGPYLDVYRKNKLEGHRITIPLRTSYLFNENFTIGGYIGAGSKDKKLKYGLTNRINIPASQYSVLGIDAWSDVRKIGHSENLFLVRENAYGSGEDNIVSAFTARRENDKISEKQYASIWYERDIRNGISTKTKLIASNTLQSPYVPFKSDTKQYSSIHQIAASFNLRLSFKENYLNEYFKRVYLGNKYPIFNFYAESGNLMLDHQSNPYLKFHTTVKQKISIGMGVFHYLIEAGKILGSVPFPFLEVHRGNETYGYARYNFNMINYLEYVSDAYVNIHTKYNFGGLVLNHIPLIRRLNFREIISFKGILGSVADKHKKIMDFPTHTSGLMQPYAEFGVGLTNIFQYGRLEYVWRLTDTNKTDIVSSGLRFRFEVSF